MYMVRDEVTEHANRYLQFLVDSSHHDLMYYMNQYVFNKMYNTNFGNLVPLVLANVLHINIAIISKDVHGYNARVIHTNASTDTLGNILVYKTADHYDSIIFKAVTTGNNSKCCDKYIRIGVSHTDRHHQVRDNSRLGYVPRLGVAPPDRGTPYLDRGTPKLSSWLCRKQFSINCNHKVDNFSIALELPARLIIYFE